MIATSFIRACYKRLLKPIYFSMDPERTHDRMTAVGRLLGSNGITRALTSLAFTYEHPLLEQDILGIRFQNPIGLSAGFDKNGLLTKIMPSVGFGFEEVGSVTGDPCPGNSGKRLWRLPKSRSLVVYYGLLNDGAEVVCKRIRQSVNPSIRKFPLGISMAKTNCEACADDDVGIADHVKSFRACLGAGDYYTINVSCPNAFGSQPFHRPEALNRLFTELDKIPTEKPIFVKLSPDTDEQGLDRIIEVANRHRIHGFILSNLTKRYDRPEINQEEWKALGINHGGLSGKVVEGATNELISYLYKKTNGKYVIIGCGGVFSAEDAYEKIKRGASLIQMITGMIYEGPQVIGEINKGLVRLLERDGYKNISEAVGKAHR